MIKREIYEALKEHLTKKQITVLIGPRQVGKTTLIEMLMADEQLQGTQTLYFNLDDDTDTTHFTSQQQLLKKLDLELGHQPATIFIDEIQRKENAGKFLKGIYDKATPYKFVVTGSGSMELKASLSESLAGRKRVFFIAPISFMEFFNYRTSYKYEGKFLTYAEVETQQLDYYLLEYISFGGYPEVILAHTQKEKRAVIQELFSSYLSKDIISLLAVSDRAAFVLMLKLLADRQGQPINFTGLANDINISRNTLMKYLYFAEETYVIRSLNPYFNNVGKELTKAPQYYFIDLGFRNFAIGQFTQLIDKDPRLGFSFQAFIYHILYSISQRNGWSLHYWRTRDQAEVDFVINRVSEVYPVEVKSRASKLPKMSRSLLSFCEKYTVQKATIVSRHPERFNDASRSPVHLEPWWQLLSGAVIPEL